MLIRRPNRREAINLTAAGVAAGLTMAHVPKAPAYVRLRRVWDEQQGSGSIIGLARGHSEDQLKALEQRYRISLPSDFRDYLRVDAVVDDNDWNWDCWGTYWWPLTRLRNIVEEFPKEAPHLVVAPVAQSTLFFCDWLVWCGAWAISCGDGPERGKIWCYWSETPCIVAADFSEFIDKYVENYGLVVP